MSNPKVSIIVPVYNVETYLDACLESLVGQTLSDIEIICIDDGSTDGSAAVINGFAKRDSRVKVLSQSNSGVAYSRNRGLDAAQGDYILFVDADDFIALRTCDELYRTASTEQADIVVFGGMSFPYSEWADQSFAQRKIAYRKNGIKALLEEPGGNPLMCNKFYDISLLNKFGLRFNEELVLGEDNAFQFTVFPRASMIVFVDDVLYFYRQHPDSAVMSRMDDHDKKLFLHFDLAKYVIQAWEELGFMSGHEQELYAWAIRLLYAEASQTSFNERTRFSYEFSAFFEPRILSGEAFLINPEILRFYDFMKETCIIDVLAPKFSVLLLALGNIESDEMHESLKSIAFQTEQALEIVVMRPSVSENPCDTPLSQGDAITRFAATDKRVRMLDSADYRQALRSMRGEYILCLPPSTGLDLSTFRCASEVIEGLCKCNEKKEAVDVLLFTDYENRLRCKNPLDICQPSIIDDMKGPWALSSEMLGDSIFGISSLALANKIIRKSHLVEFLEAGSSSLYGLYAQAVIHAHKVVQLDELRMSLFPVRFMDSQTTLAVTQRLVESWGVRTYAEFDQESEVELRCSIALFLLSYLELVRERDMFIVAHEVVQKYLLDLSIPALLHERKWFTSSDAARIGVLCMLSGNACFDAVNCALVDELLVSQRFALLEAQKNGREVQRLRIEIRDFYDSMSYRVGHAVALAWKGSVRLVRSAFK